MKKALRILIVDDNEALLSTSKLMFTALGHRPVTAIDGRQALDILLKEGDFDLVFTDLGMPNMDGWELARLIRSSGFENPIIVVSGVSSSVNETRMAELDIHGKIDKPFKLNDLSSILNSVEEELALK